MTSYKEILERRSALPRREYLEERLISNRRTTTKVEQKYRESMRTLAIKRKELNILLDSYKYSLETLKVLAKTEELPEEPGVYVIYVKEQAVYVGESVNVRNRALSHLHVTLRSSHTKIPPLYELLRATPLNEIEIRLESVVSGGKSARLQAEALRIREALMTGAELTNYLKEKYI